MSSQNIVKVTYSLDKKIVETLEKMSAFTKRDVNQLVTTALKFFIATHNDFLGPNTLEKDKEEAPARKKAE